MAQQFARDPMLPALDRMGAWVRGPATIHGARLVMDFAKREQYWPTTETNLVALALTQVRDGKSAIEFVEKFGLLRKRPMYSDDEYIDGVPSASIPRKVSEPVAEMLKAARHMHEVVTVLVDFRKICDQQDEGDIALQRLSDWAALAFPPHLRYPRGGASRSKDVQFLRDVELWIASELTQGLRGVQIWVTGGSLSTLQLGEFRFAVGEPSSLLQFCFFQLSQMAIGRMEIRQCEERECRKMFRVEDGRQRFCSKACATRDRVRRWRRQ